MFKMYLFVFFVLIILKQWLSVEQVTLLHACCTDAVTAVDSYIKNVFFKSKIKVVYK